MTKEVPTATATQYKPGEGTMKALTWYGTKDVRLAEHAIPTITDPDDIIIQSTAATVCGSDLHLFHGMIPNLKKGEILGHEGVGIVHQVGAKVVDFRPGDRVVASFSIGCGKCRYCKDNKYSMCEETNPSKDMQELYGQKIGGILGYSHLLGGYAGTQAEYFRMPFGEVNCFHLPPEVPDEKAILLADVTPTSYHAVVDIDFKEGETAAIWGAGPIGQLIAQWLVRVFGAKKVIIIDNVAPRLQWVKDRLNVEVVNFDHTPKVAEELLKKVPGGVDVSFDAAGFRYAKSFYHKAMQSLNLQTDTPENLNEAIRATRKFGRISVIADYVGLCNGFLIGALMEKGVTLKGCGQAPTQGYMDKIINEYVVTGKFDPTLILTHRFKFEDIAKAYKAFDEKRFDESKGIPYIKAFLETKYAPPPAKARPHPYHSESYTLIMSNPTSSGPQQEIAGTLPNNFSLRNNMKADPKVPLNAVPNPETGRDDVNTGGRGGDVLRQETQAHDIDLPPNKPHNHPEANESHKKVYSSHKGPDKPDV